MKFQATVKLQPVPVEASPINQRVFELLSKAVELLRKNDSDVAEEMDQLIQTASE